MDVAPVIAGSSRWGPNKLNGHMRLLVRLLTPLCLIWIGCGLGNSDAQKGDEDNPKEELFVVASKLYDSHTYQDFLDSFLAPEDSLVWIDASRVGSSELDSLSPHAHAVLLTGGPDIHPEHYQRPQFFEKCGAIDVARDSLELRLLRWVENHQTPCLGICRGLQWMNVHGGGTLHPHLPDAFGTHMHRGGTPEHSRDTTHLVSAVDDQFAMEMSATSLVVSHHHQGIDALAPDLTVWAVAPDGLIEGVRRTDTVGFPFYVGVQWHPERSVAGQPMVDQLGLHFLRHARLNRRKQISH